MNLKRIGTVFTSKFVGTEPSSYEKRIYRAAVSQMLTNTGLRNICSTDNPEFCVTRLATVNTIFKYTDDL